MQEKFPKPKTMSWQLKMAPGETSTINEMILAPRQSISEISEI